MKKWICYILKNDSIKFQNCTYNGMTNNFKRRIRQHNSIIKGGAKYTRGKGPWQVYCMITGFKDKISALQAEWRIKRVEGKRRPSKYCRPDGRIKGLNKIFTLEKFTSNCKENICDMNLTIYIDQNYKQFLQDIPENISIKNINEYEF